MSNNEITQEERERIIRELKDSESFEEGKCEFSVILGKECSNTSCSKCAKIVRKKLLALIEPELKPAKKNMQASELANRLERSYEKTQDTFKTFKEVLGYDISYTQWNEDIKYLIDVLRNLDSSENSVKWPLDADGIEIKPGDTVYMNNCKYTVAYIAYLPIGTMVKLDDGTTWLLHDPEVFSHNRPRTLNSIKEEIYDKLVFDTSKDVVSNLIDEAYEMGKGNNNG